MKKKQIIGFAAVLVMVIGALAYVAFGNLSQNLVYYWTPVEVLQRADKIAGQTVRLGGLVQAHSVDWNAQTLHLAFKVADKDAPDATTVLVEAQGAPPQMFREGIGVVVEGRYDGTVFNAERVMVKHGNDYHPPKDGKAPHEMAGK